VSLAFRYRAATPRGDLVEGVIQAADVRAASEELRRQTLVPVWLESQSGTPTHRTRWIPRLGASRSDAVATAFRTLAALLAGGQTGSLDRALQFAADNAEHPELREALGAIRLDIQRGQPLHAAFRERRELFGGLATAIIRAGEESGTLDAALTRLADHHERARDVRAQVQGALLYPALLALVAGVGITVLLTVVVPRFVAMLGVTGGELPLSTRTLVAASSILTRGWWVWLGVLLLGALVARQARLHPVWRSRWHAFRLKLPIAGRLEADVWTARYARALGVLLNGGAATLTALRVAQEGVGNEAVSAGIASALSRVERGDRLGTALSGVLPPLATQLLSVGEESGTLGDMADRVADNYENSVQRGLRTLASLLEPVLIVVFGGLVGFVALAMLQAIYSVNASVI
jgi:type II secretory pathway component PulF